MKDDKPSTPKGVEAVERALTIVEAFDQGEPELSLAELSRRTGFYKSTILRLAVSLEKFGYLVRLETGQFRLGPTTWRMGSHYRQGFHLPEIIRPELRALTDATSETASFYIREGNLRVCLYRNEPQRSIRHTVDEGKAVSVDLGASGKALLAFSELDEGDPAVRAQGYAVSWGERDGEVAAVAVPIYTNTGSLKGVISVSGLITRFDEARIPGLVSELVAAQVRLKGQLTD